MKNKRWRRDQEYSDLSKVIYGKFYIEIESYGGGGIWDVYVFRKHPTDKRIRTMNAFVCNIKNQPNEIKARKIANREGIEYLRNLRWDLNKLFTDGDLRDD